MGTHIDVVTLRLGTRTVAEYVLAPDLDPRYAPRPYLHPVRTLGGALVTDVLPEDHRWHLGAGLAVQDVAGTNLWGGRTYLRDSGYTWLPDHGRIEHLSWVRREPDRLVHRLAWRDPAGATLLTEERTIAARELPGGAHARVRDGARGQAAGAARNQESGGAWVLDFGYRLSAPPGRNITLGSPATNGRPGGAGYGGFFWRAAPGPPQHPPPRVFTASAQGEEAVNGSAEPWLAMVGADPSAAPYTLVFTGLGDGDRWFVRSAMYPGVCVAFAFDRPRVIPAGQHRDGRHAVVVADGALSTQEAAELAAG